MRIFCFTGTAQTQIQTQNSGSGHIPAVVGAIVVHRCGGFNSRHRRGGFANSWEFIAAAVENAPPRISSKTDGNLTVLTEKIGRLQTEAPLFLMRGPGLVTNAFGRQFGRLSDSSRTLLGCLPDAPRTPPGRSSDASRTLFGRLPDSSLSRRCLLKLRCLLKRFV